MDFIILSGEDSSNEPIRLDGPNATVSSRRACRFHQMLQFACAVGVVCMSCLALSVRHYYENFE